MRAPPLPATALAPQTRRWLWTCRAGFESSLYEELAWAKCSPRLLGETFVESAPPPRTLPTFGRMGFPVSAVVATPEAAQDVLGEATGMLQVWSADGDGGHALKACVARWEARLGALRAEQGLGDVDTPWKAHEAGAWLLQVCLVGPDLAAVGLVRAREAVSLAAGGVSRMRRNGAAPSRSAMKLDEALDWYGVSPGKGERCVDLGSAPGGWTLRLANLGAKVWSVDPANLAPDVEQHPRVRHFKSNAFDFEPPEPADWLFCDMAWRPLEVAQLLARWGRQGWAAQVIANLKLPMKDTLPTLLRARSALEDGGWKRVNLRQLYHDRDEVTLTARKG